MANLRLTLTAGRPVTARDVLVRRKRGAVRSGAGEDVVHVRRLPHAVHLIELFRDSHLLVDSIAVAVELVDVRGDEQPFSVVPGPAADPIPRVDCRLAICARGAEIRPPGMVAGALCFRERLTVRVGSAEPAKIPALSRARTRDEKRHHRPIATHRKRLRYGLFVCRRRGRGSRSGFIAAAARRRDDRAERQAQFSSSTHPSHPTHHLFLGRPAIVRDMTYGRVTRCVYTAHQTLAEWSMSLTTLYLLILGAARWAPGARLASRR